MQITSYYPNVSINTANPATELARRDMQRRELVEPVRELDKGKAERAVATEEKGRSGTGGPVNYDAIGKSTESQQVVAGRQEQAEDNSQQQPQQDTEQQQQQQQQQAEQPELTEGQALDRQAAVSHQFDNLAQMQRRSQVISQFYQLATEPAQRSLRQQA